jgi:hypothetical protein
LFDSRDILWKMRRRFLQSRREQHGAARVTMKAKKNGPPKRIA